MGRVPEGGRNFEGFGADPYLAGEAAFETVAGLQKHGVQACAKHYLNNEQEHDRTTTTSQVSDRVQHELYLHPFLRSVQAGVSSVMCSYNLINGTYACQNDVTLNGWLKGEFGFEGYVMSDWGANHATHSATNGLDMTMPGAIQADGTDEFFGSSLVEAVRNGTVQRERLEDMATRIVAAWFAMGQDSDYPDVNFNAFSPNGTINKHVDVQEDHYQLIRKIGAASTVLLKNLGSLPLRHPRSLVLIGSDAGPSLNGPNYYQDRAGIDGIVAQGWGSGTADYPYLISPLEAIQARAREEHTSLSWYLHDFNLQQAAQASLNKDVAIVFIAAISGEEYLNVDGNVGDRKNLTAWNGGDALVEAVAAQNPNTIVVVHSVGPILMPWANHENITAIVWAGISGQEAGNSLTDVLYGDWNPSGRLPYTIAKTESDYKTRILPNSQEVVYSEGWVSPLPMYPRSDLSYPDSISTIVILTQTALSPCSNLVSASRIHGLSTLACTHPSQTTLLPRPKTGCQGLQRPVPETTEVHWRIGAYKRPRFCHLFNFGVFPGFIGNFGRSNSRSRIQGRSSARRYLSSTLGSPTRHKNHHVCYEDSRMWC